MDGNKGFKYTYTAPTEEERREIAAIKRQYETNKKNGGGLDRLRRLDAKVRNVPTAVSLVLGVFGTLLFGFGLACILELSMITLGIVFAAVGTLPIAFAYPAHTWFSYYYRKKHGEEIIKLSNELLGDGAD